MPLAHTGAVTAELRAISKRTHSKKVGGGGGGGGISLLAPHCILFMTSWTVPTRAEGGWGGEGVAGLSMGPHAAVCLSPKVGVSCG